MIASWASAVAWQECTIKEPSDEIRLSLMLAKDRAEAEKRRKRRKVSPTSSNSSIEGLTKAILAGHLAQMSSNRCCHQSTQSTPSTRWEDFDCPRLELFQHTYNFFDYWKHAMPSMRQPIQDIRASFSSLRGRALE